MKINKRLMRSVFNWKILSFLKIVNFRSYITFSIILNFANFSISIWEFILLSGLSMRNTSNVFCLGWNWFLWFFTVFVSVVSWSLNCLSFLNLTPIFVIPIIIQSFIQISAPFVFQNRCEEIILKLVESVSPEIFKDVVSSHRGNFTKWNNIIVISFGLIWKCIISFINFIEFLSGISTVCIAFRMIFQRESSVSFFNFI